MIRSSTTSLFTFRIPLSSLRRAEALGRREAQNRLGYKALGLDVRRGGVCIASRMSDA